jgi:hypothetical protein
MPAPDKATLADHLGLLESIETDLAKRATDPAIKKVLTANAQRAARIAQRLAEPTAESWLAYLEDVMERNDGDPAKDFLYISAAGYETESVTFLEIMTRVVLEHAEFTEAKYD